MRALALLLLLPLVCCASRINFEQFREGINAAGVWSGGPEAYFERVGRMTLATAIEYGHAVRIGAPVSSRDYRPRRRPW